MTSATPRRWRAFACSLIASALFAAPGAAAVAATSEPPAGTTLPAQKTVVVFGENIRYYEIGHGPTVVLVHGLGSSAKGDWGRVMQSMAVDHRVLALDLLGFGNSDKPVIVYGIQIWVDVLGEFLRLSLDAKGEPFTLVGESLGGWIAAQYTIQALGNVAMGPSFVLPKPSKLLLADAAGFSRASVARLGDRSAPTRPSGLSLAEQKGLLGSIFHDPAFVSDEGLRTGMAWAMGKGDGWTIVSLYGNPGLVHEAVEGKLGGVDIPTLVVWGQYDRLVPLSEGEGYAAAIRNARLVVIPDSGHAPMIEAPAKFLRAVESFL